MANTGASAVFGAAVFDAAEFDVLVEIRKGQRNKYEMDHTIGRICLDRCLFTATSYPADYGYIENTLALDGEPLYAMVLIGEPTFPGRVVRCRPLGMLCMFDESGRDDKVFCVPAADTRLEQLRDIMHVPEFDKLEFSTSSRCTKTLSRTRRSRARCPGWDAALLKPKSSGRIVVRASGGPLRMHPIPCLVGLAGKTGGEDGS